MFLNFAIMGIVLSFVIDNLFLLWSDSMLIIPHFFQTVETYNYVMWVRVCISCLLNAELYKCPLCFQRFGLIWHPQQLQVQCLVVKLWKLDLNFLEWVEQHLLQSQRLPWPPTGPPPTPTSTTTTSTNTITIGFIFSRKPVISIGINDTVRVGFASTPFTLAVNFIIMPVMTYGQLASLINKWNLELEDQEVITRSPRPMLGTVHWLTIVRRWLFYMEKWKKWNWIRKNWKKNWIWYCCSKRN